MKRVQRKRTPGFKLPPNTRCVDRTTKFGNPFKIGEPIPMFIQFFESEFKAVLVFGNVKTSLTGKMLLKIPLKDNEEVCAAFFLLLEHIKVYYPQKHKALKTELSQYDHLACFCSMDTRCHADVLIEAVGIQKKES